MKHTRKATEDTPLNRLTNEVETCWIWATDKEIRLDYSPDSYKKAIIEWIVEGKTLDRRIEDRLRRYYKDKWEYETQTEPFKEPWAELLASYPDFKHYWETIYATGERMHRAIEALVEKEWDNPEAKAIIEYMETFHPYYNKFFLYKHLFCAGMIAGKRAERARKKKHTA